jgi:hypothetical protein
VRCHQRPQQPPRRRSSLLRGRRPSASPALAILPAPQAAHPSPYPFSCQQ